MAAARIRVMRAEMFFMMWLSFRLRAGGVRSSDAFNHYILPKAASMRRDGPARTGRNGGNAQENLTVYMIERHFFRNNGFLGDFSRFFNARLNATLTAMTQGQPTLRNEKGEFLE